MRVEEIPEAVTQEVDAHGGDGDCEAVVGGWPPRPRNLRKVSQVISLVTSRPEVTLMLLRSKTARRQRPFEDLPAGAGSCPSLAHVFSATFVSPW